MGKQRGCVPGLPDGKPLNRVTCCKPGIAYKGNYGGCVFGFAESQTLGLFSTKWEEKAMLPQTRGKARHRILYGEKHTIQDGRA